MRSSGILNSGLPEGLGEGGGGGVIPMVEGRGGEEEGGRLGGRTEEGRGEGEMVCR